MANYRLSIAAEEDLRAIARASIRDWGRARAERYILGLPESFARLVEFPASAAQPTTFYQDISASKSVAISHFTKCRLAEC